MNSIAILKLIDSKDINTILTGVKMASSLPFSDFKYILSEAVFNIAEIKETYIHEIMVDKDYQQWNKEDLLLFINSITNDQSLLYNLVKASRSAILLSVA